MSYEIEYSKHAFKAKDRYGNDVFFTYVMTCSNNVDPRTPRPFFVGIGQGWEIIRKVCVLAGECESGCIRPKNRGCSPESYIRRWREILRDAPSLETTNLRLKLTMKHEELEHYLDKDNVPTDPDDKRRWDTIRDLLEPFPFSDVTTWYKEKHRSVEIPVTSYLDIERAIELQRNLREVSLLCWNIEIIL